MKKLLISICTIFIVGFTHADTIDINWMVGDSVYETSTCTVDGDLIVPSAPPTKYGYTFQGWSTDYVRLEYIQSNGSQYIDTKIQDTSKVELQLEFVAVNTNYNLVYGSQKGQNNTAIRRSVLLNNDTYKFGLSSGSVAKLVSLSTNSAISIGVKYNLVAKFSDIPELILDDDISVSNRVSDNASTGLNDYLFCYNIDGRYNYISRIKMYAAKIYKKGVLVRDFIPVKRLSDNAIGMFDAVTTTFFGNDGTENFVAGPEVR